MIYLIIALVISIIINIIACIKASYRKKIIDNMCQRVYKLRQILIKQYKWTNNKLNDVLDEK